jgi:hypothetical protein
MHLGSKCSFAAPAVLLALVSSCVMTVETAVSYPMFMLVADSSNGLRRLDLVSTSVSTLNTLNNPAKCVALSQSNIFTLFTSSNSVFKLDLGTMSVTQIAGSSGTGSADGIGTLALFNQPRGLVVSSDASFALVCDYNNHALRKIILSNGTVSRIAGTLSAGNVDGSGLGIALRQPWGVDISSNGAFAVVSEFGGHRLRKINLTVTPVTSSFIAGSKTDTYGFNDGVGAGALFYCPAQLAISPDMTFVLLADVGNNRVRKVLLSTGAVTSLVYVASANQYGVALLGVSADWFYFTGATNIYKYSDTATAIVAGSPIKSAGSSDGPQGNLALFTSVTGLAIMKCTVPGYGANSSTGMCSECAAGTYSAAGVCVPCPFKTTSTAGSSVCTVVSLSPGRFYNSTSISLCPSGTYSTGIDATACTKCSSGTYSTARGAELNSTCMDCTPGTYSNQDTASSCTHCAAGTYSTQNSSSVCTQWRLTRPASCLLPHSVP